MFWGGRYIYIRLGCRNIFCPTNNEGPPKSKGQPRKFWICMCIIECYRRLRIFRGRGRQPNAFGVFFLHFLLALGIKYIGSRLLSLSRSLDLSRPNRGVSEASRARHGAEGGGVDVDKITSSC